MLSMCTPSLLVVPRLIDAKIHITVPPFVSKSLHAIKTSIHYSLSKIHMSRSLLPSNHYLWRSFALLTAPDLLS